MITWDLDPIAFGNVRYYSICFVLTLVFGYFVVRRHLLRAGADREEAGELVPYCYLGLLGGARIGDMVFFQFEEFVADPLITLQLWRGGLSGHGAILGLALAILLFVRRRGVPFLETTDRVAFAAPVATLLFRLGNLFNSELVGIPTRGDWGIAFPRYDNISMVIPRHPVQLYEMLGAILTWGILIAVDRAFGKEERPRGLITGTLLVSHFGLRSIVELWRDKVPSTIDVQVLNALAVAIGVGILVYSLRHRKKAGWTFA